MSSICLIFWRLCWYNALPALPLLKTCPWKKYLEIAYVRVTLNGWKLSSWPFNRLRDSWKNNKNHPQENCPCSSNWILENDVALGCYMQWNTNNEPPPIVSLQKKLMPTLRLNTVGDLHVAPGINITKNKVFSKKPSCKTSFLGWCLPNLVFQKRELLIFSSKGQFVGILASQPTPPPPNIALLRAY